MGLWCHQLPNVNALKIFCFWPHLYPHHHCGSAHNQDRHHSACKLNKQDDNIQPWCTPFLIWDQSGVPCPVLTVPSWPAYRFFRRQIRRSGIPISLKNFPQFVVIQTIKVFGVVNKAEVDVFSGTVLLFLWSSGCWQFILCFLCKVS